MQHSGLTTTVQGRADGRADRRAARAGVHRGVDGDPRASTWAAALQYALHCEVMDARRSALGRQLTLQDSGEVRGARGEAGGTRGWRHKSRLEVEGVLVCT
eukprot:COSAG02_NODE_372_length_23640_cov_210.100463_12_plen_101_part_00